jgi:hypothetical protein
VDETIVKTPLTPFSNKLYNRDLMNCIDSNTYEALVHMPSKFEVDQIRHELFLNWTGKFEFDRISTLNWVIEVALKSQISDEALFKAVSFAEIILTNFHSRDRKEKVPQRLQFMILFPHYVYIICLLMAAKMVDPTYPSLSMYMRLFQSIQPNFSDHRVQRGLIESDFVQLELDFINFVGELYATTSYMLMQRVTSPYD